MKTAFLMLALVALLLLTMAPSYVAGSAVSLAPGDCKYLLSAEQPATGAYSQQFVLATANGQSTPNLSFEFTFAAAPGAFNEQIQDADTDTTGSYVTVPAAGTVTSCPQTAGGAFTCRVELNPWRGKFGRIYTNLQNANAVNLTVQVCR